MKAKSQIARIYSEDAIKKLNKQEQKAVIKFFSIIGCRVVSEGIVLDLLKSTVLRDVNKLNKTINRNKEE